MNKQRLNKIYEEIKPLNLGRRLMFQKYCEYLVKEKLMEKCDVEKFLSEKFLFEDNKMLEEVRNAANQKKKIAEWAKIKKEFITFIFKTVSED